MTATFDISSLWARYGAPSATLPPARLYEQALTLWAIGFHKEATAGMHEVVTRAPGHGPARQKLASWLRLAGEDQEADAAALGAERLPPLWPPAAESRSPADIETAERGLREQMRALASPAEALQALRERLRNTETDVTAMRLLARLEWNRNHLWTARALLERALVLAHQYEGARADLARLLQALRDDGPAMAECRRLLAIKPENITYRAMYADALRNLGDNESAVSVLRQLVRDEPAEVNLRYAYAHMLRVGGRGEESARELRSCLEREPGMGDAYWGLAVLHGDFVTNADIAAIREHLRDEGQSETSRMRLENALGLALEQRGDFAGSFHAYEAGAALSEKRGASRGELCDLGANAGQLERRRAVFTPAFFTKRAMPASPSDCTPIFVVGLPRAGSTLVEQILGSHSLVEATMELPVLRTIVRDLSLSRVVMNPDAYPECLLQLGKPQLVELGQRYIDETAVYRRTDRPYFVDKLPWNWVDAGLIRLILPQAKIVDIRREPMAACFAIFKNIRVEAFHMPYDLAGLAKYYRQYAGMMAHYESVMPGHIHFLGYEKLVEDPDGEIRRMLGYCGLPFEESCVRFWESGRAVPTVSSEQVRRPIYKDAVQQWRNFEPWLGPLKTALSEPDHG